MCLSVSDNPWVSALQPHLRWQQVVTEGHHIGVSAFYGYILYPQSKIHWWLPTPLRLKSPWLTMSLLFLIDATFIMQQVNACRKLIWPQGISGYSMSGLAGLTAWKHMFQCVRVWVRSNNISKWYKQMSSTDIPDAWMGSFLMFQSQALYLKAIHIQQRNNKSIIDPFLPSPSGCQLELHGHLVPCRGTGWMSGFSCLQKNKNIDFQMVTAFHIQVFLSH